MEFGIHESKKFCENETWYISYMTDFILHIQFDGISREILVVIRKLDFYNESFFYDM